MKPTGGAAALLAALLALLLVLPACAGSAPPGAATVPWKDYTLQVRSLRGEAAAGKDTMRLVLALDYAGDTLGKDSQNGILMETIDEQTDFAPFVLLDAQNEPHSPTGIRYNGIALGRQGKFEINPVQPGFSLVFELPTETDVNALKLQVGDTAVELKPYLE